MRISMVMPKTVTMRLRVVEPTSKATHIEVCVSHRNKKVLLDVDPIFVGDQMVRRTIDFTSKRNGRLPLADMPRMAPKKFAAIADAVRDVVEARDESHPVWLLIRAAAKEYGVAIPNPVIIDE